MKKYVSVGDGIEIRESNNFNFKAKTAKVFNTHALKSIPFYEQGHDLILQYSNFFIRPNSTVYDLGCSTGTLLNKLIKQYKKINAIGIDSEKDMIKEARKNTTAILLNSNIQDVSYKNADVFIAYYTLQFLNQNDKEQVASSVYNSLNQGGAFFVFEKVIYNNPVLQTLTSSLYHEYKKKYYSLQEIENKAKSLRNILNCSTSRGNKRLLKRVGFNIETIFKYLCFEGYLAIKQY
jgi:tRNA (cmo5U34)-methyltransferase